MRILGVDIPDNKIGEVSLSYIFGIGRPMAKRILKKTGVGNKKVLNWTDEDKNKIRAYLALHNIKIEGELRAEVKMNIKLLEDIKCYRGIRHRKGLPVRGQQTRTNCRTRKGKKKTVANKKKAEK